MAIESESGGPEELRREALEYYKARAPEYDRSSGYEDPESEERRIPVKERYQRLFAGLDVLEVACGTGYWTEVIAAAARSVFAVDLNTAVLERARTRLAGAPNVIFERADAYSLEAVPEGFDGAFAIYWWSHMPRTQWPGFIRALHGKLRPGARVLLVDQIPEAYEPTHRRCLGEDVVEDRVLSDGRTFRVLKNFPTAQDFQRVLGESAERIEFREHPAEGNWNLSYRLK